MRDLVDQVPAAELCHPCKFHMPVGMLPTAIKHLDKQMKPSFIVWKMRDSPALHGLRKPMH